ncbi:MAG: hypothetical protein U0P81_12305 [Holophagaceae bacterium]
MSRVLFVVPPFPSHIFPTLALARELERRGHEPAWVCYRALLGVLPPGARVHVLDSPVSAEAVAEVQRQAGAPWLEGLRVFFEAVVFPMARDMLPGVEAAVDAFRPDLLVADQQCTAGALAARRRGLPWATLSTSAALLGSPLQAYPKVEAWLVSRFEALQREAGLEPVRWPDRSERLVLLTVSRRFAGEGSVHPPSHRFVGPLLEARPAQGSFPWEALGPGPRIYAGLGTLFTFKGAGFYRALVEALGDAEVQVVVSDPDGLLPAAPANFLVRRWVPLLDLYPRLDAVITHAGTTILEAFVHGLPAVATPITQDQGTYAGLAAATGAAIRLPFNRLRAAELRGAVEAVLGDPAYRAAAEGMRDSLRAAGGAPAAVDALEELLA